MSKTGFDYHRLGAFNKKDTLHVIIETPKGSRNKLKYDEEYHIFTLSHILPAGAIFPFDFGFIPATKGGDGDPLDILILMDEPVYPGVLVKARLLGGIEARQGDKKERNDRLIAVSTESQNHKGIESFDELEKNLLEEIGHFFKSYNEMRERAFEIKGHYGPLKALKRVKEAAKRFESESDE